MLVPSPNVAADHQTKNAQVLEAHQAAILVPDNEAERRIPAELPDLLKDQPQLAKLAEQIRAFARPAATQHIVEEVFSLAGKSFRKDSAKAVDEQRLTSSVNPKAES
jgi:UDP-N-acetylglucosamine--N-acetylmuramyl-(pentapeptide) pyrophosphoryl-undecaprenol N-acetylglucosamine transferase